MSFNVQFYINSSENNRLTKDIALQTTLTGTLKNECSVVDPIVLVAGNVSTFSGINYMYIPEFKRYYFINNVRSIRSNLVEITGHVDVLMSFADGIRSNSAIIKRQEGQWNLYLNDGSLKCYQNPLILTKAFPSGFSTQEFVLAVAGA